MPKSGIAGYPVPASWGTAHQFPQWLYKFVLLPAMGECFLFLYSISLHAWAIICFIDLGYSDLCILFPFCNLLLCLNDGILCNVEAFQLDEVPFILLFLVPLLLGFCSEISFPGSVHSGLFPTFTEDPDTCLHTYRQVSFDLIKKPQVHTGRQHLPKIVLVKLDGCM